MKSITKWWLGAATAWAWTLGVDAAREWADWWQTATEIAGATGWVVDWVNDIISSWTNLVENIPIVWQAAPFAFPVIAGAKWAHMLASKYGPDSMWFKWLATATWGALGWAATLTFLWKYLTIAGLWVAAWKSPKVLEWIARKWIAAPTQWVKWIWDGWKRGKNAVTAKNWSGWENWVFA